MKTSFFPLNGKSNAICCISVYIFLFAIILFCIGYGTAQRIISVDLQKHFQIDAIQKWHEYINQINQFDGNAIFTLKIDDKYYVNTHHKIMHNSNCRLHIEQSCAGESQNGHAFVYNCDYCFSLIRSRADSPWIIQNLSMKKNADLVHAEEREITKRMVLLRNLVRLPGIDLLDLVSKPSFQITKIASIERYGKQVIQVDFVNQHDLDIKKIKQFDPIQSGSLILDPDLYWCLRHAEYQSRYINAEVTSTLDTEIITSADGIPIPKKIIESSIQKSTNGNIQNTTIIVEYDLYKSESLPPDREFTLAAFGFPEPLEIVETRRTRWYLWISIAGLLCVIAGVALYALRHRTCKLTSRGST